MDQRTALDKCRAPGFLTSIDSLSFFTSEEFPYFPLLSHVLQKDSYCLSNNYFLEAWDVSRNVCLIAGAPVSRSSTSCPRDGSLPLLLSPLLSQVMHGFPLTQPKFFKHCAKGSPYLSTQTPCCEVDFGFTSHSFLFHTELSYGTIKENTSHRGKKMYKRKLSSQP